MVSEGWERFFDEDYNAYIKLMREWCVSYGLEVWSYCLMPNHVHLVVVPEHEDSLARGIGEAHRRYTRHINFKKGWKGYLWQGRFASFPMDEDYQWSSARAHLLGEDDELVKVKLCWLEFQIGQSCWLVVIRNCLMMFECMSGQDDRSVERIL